MDGVSADTLETFKMFFTLDFTQQQKEKLIHLNYNLKNMAMTMELHFQ
jgi:hypothetical protein